MAAPWAGLWAEMSAPLMAETLVVLKDAMSVARMVGRSGGPLVGSTAEMSAPRSVVPMAD